MGTTDDLAKILAWLMTVDGAAGLKMSQTTDDLAKILASDQVGGAVGQDGLMPRKPSEGAESTSAGKTNGNQVEGKEKGQSDRMATLEKENADESSKGKTQNANGKTQNSKKRK